MIRSFALACLLLCSVCLLLCSACVARGDDPPTSDELSQQAQLSSAVQQLPTQLPDGRSIRSIGIFQSQLAELVPEHYMPVELSKLSDAVEALTVEESTPQAAQIRSSQYVVRLRDDTLVSDRSTIDIGYSGDAPTSQSLGKVNFAIDPLPTRSVVTNDSMPRLESHVDGTLHAIVDSDAVISFVWSLRGRQRGAAREFDLRIPRAPQTRIEIATPRDVRLEALDGVLRQLPAPPPGTSSMATELDTQWWRIEAGGLNLVRLRTATVNESLESDSMIVRRVAMQYEIDHSGVNWTCRMSVQPPNRDGLPPLVVRGASIVSLSVDSVETKFTTLVRNDSGQVVQIQMPSQMVRPTTGITINVVGFSSWEEVSGWCELPMPVWFTANLVQTAATSQVQLRLSNSLQLAAWELPALWTREFMETPSDDSTLISAEGPPTPALVLSPATSPPAGVESSIESVLATKESSWSRVRVIPRQTVRSYDATLALSIGDGSMDARLRLAVALTPNRLEPLRLKLQRGWNLLTMSLPTSGRVIETPSIDERSNTFTIWPEPEDLVDGQVLIELTGRTRLAAVQRGFTIPASWFARVDEARGALTAAIIAPPTLKWSGDTTMRLTRLLPEVLTGPQSTFLGTLPTDALLLRPELLRTPTLSVQPPSIAFDVSSVLEIRREGDEWVESLELQTESASPLATSLNVATGPEAGRGTYRWLLRSASDTAPVSLSPASITHGNGDPTGMYQIDISNRDIRGKTLIGRRRYPAIDLMTIELPRVPDAASQNAEVLIGEGITIADRSSSVLSVPIVDSIASNLTDAGHTQTLATRLRYDPVDQPSITLANRVSDPNVNLVWNKLVRVIASSRGSDAIELRMEVSSMVPITIKSPPELKLTSVFRDSLQTKDLHASVGSITLPASGKSTSIRVLWTRNQAIGGWWRRCRIPRIETNGVVVDERSHLVASSDSFVPATLWLAHSGSSLDSNVCIVAPESRKLVIHHNVVLALGWWFSLLVFAASWWVSRHSTMMIAALVAMSVVLAVLWAPWSLAVIGWVIVPASAAALLTTAIEYRDYWSNLNHRTKATQSKTSRGSATTPDDYSLSNEYAGGRSFSYDAPRSSAFWWVAVALVTWSVTKSFAQEPRVPTNNTGPATVLVPVGADGNFVGDMVYVPESVYATLFEAQDSNQAEVVRFQFADYRVKLDPSSQTVPLFVAEYVVRVSRGSTQIVLPLAAASVRRVELVGPDDERIVRFAAHDENSIAVTVPPASLLRLRVTLIPTMIQTPQGTVIDLRVPPIASARLAVEADREIESLIVDGAVGRVDVRRSIADLGPATRITLRYQSRDRVQPLGGQSLNRRYWIHCGQLQTAVDCEITPTTSVLSGERIQLVVYDSTMPTLASPSWQIIASEMLSPMRRQLTLVSLSDVPTPIRLLWNLQSLVNDPAVADERIAMSIPEVSLPMPSQQSSAWVALHSDPDLRVEPSNLAVVEPIAVDQFLESWNGYRDRIDRSFAAIDKLPPLVLTREATTEPTVSAQHHLQVSTGELQLRYQARVISDPTSVLSPSLRIPKGLELWSVAVNGVAVESNKIAVGGDSEVLLGPLPRTSPVTITAIASAPLSSGGRFTPPRMELWPPMATVDTYTLSRDTTTRVKTIAPSTIPSRDLATAPTGASADASATGAVLNRTSDAELLTSGFIPVASWAIEQSVQQARERLAAVRLGSENRSTRFASRLPGGVFEASAQSNRFGTNQLILLAWQDGRWSMQSHIQIASGAMPDFLDVEVPTRWCESLEVSPAAVWSRQPSTDPQLQVIRIQCEPTPTSVGTNPESAARNSESSSQTISIFGQLKSSDKARISVPAVSVLGGGPRRVWISVPERLTNETMRWRSSAVTSVELPEKWQSFMPPAATERSTFSATRAGWSIELASLPRATANASITGVETQVYFSSDSILSLTRVDVVPAGLTSIDVILPNKAKLIGAWSAGNAVDASPVAESTVRVPLALDRLSQGVELLYRLPSVKSLENDYVAKVREIDQPPAWICVYELSDSAMNRQHPSSLARSAFDANVVQANPEQYALQQATSVVEAVERSLDNLAERPADEIVTWVRPWIDRYLALAAMVGRNVNLVELMNSVDTLPGEQPDSAWLTLDRRIGVFIRRFPDVSQSTTQLGNHVASRFSAGGFDGYQRIGLMRIASTDAAPPTVHAFSQETAPLRSFITNVLTLMTVIAVIVLVWPFRRHVFPIVHHPAFWIGAIGVCCFFVAPRPVAAAMLIVALIMPIYPTSKTTA